MLASLQQLVRFPSVSASPAHARDVRRCAEWLAGYLGKIGMQHVQVVATPRHPLVFAEWRGRPGRPTILIYGHYDVQPVEPAGAWQRPPFEAVVEGDYLYGRGSSDDKGQFFAHIAALEGYFKVAGGPPANVICLFEGEEEITSPNLPAFIDRNRRALRSDVAVVSDTRMLGPDRPVISYGLRGKLGVELTVKTLNRSLHSGAFGGAVYNSLQLLSEIIAGLHDASGRIALPGFYGRVRPTDTRERELLRRDGPLAQALLRDAGGGTAWGEAGWSLYERTTLRPALTVNKIFTEGEKGEERGHGLHDVIPSAASAQLVFRLVPDQDPETVERQLSEHVGRNVPGGVQWSVKRLAAAHPVLLPRDHPALNAADWAYTYSFGRAPVYLRSGGTIPIVSLLQRKLGIPTALMGFALSSDRMHAPNERFYLPSFFKGIAASALFMHAAASGLGAPERPFSDRGFE